MPLIQQENTETFPKDENGKFIFSDVDYLETWRGMEHCVEISLTRSIGVSNFNSHQLQRLIDNAKIKPAVLQVQFEYLLRYHYCRTGILHFQSH